MAVEAVNGVDQQQRTQHSVGAAIGTGVVGGGLGYLGGYLATNKRPNLDEVFAMKNDEFVAATKDTEGKVKEAADKIAKARTEYANAGDKVAVKNKGIELAKQIKDSLEDKAALKAKINEAKGAFDATAKVEITNHKGETAQVNQEEVMNAVKNAQEKVKAATTDEAKNAAKEELSNAKKDAKAYLAKVNEKWSAINDANAELTKAERAAYNAKLEAEGDNAAKTAKTAYTKAVDDLKEAKSNKLNEIKGRDEIKQAYEEIKSLFKKKHNAKTAWIAAAAAAAVGLIAGYMLSGKPAEAPQETQA